MRATVLICLVAVFIISCPAPQKPPPIPPVPIAPTRVEKYPAEGYTNNRLIVITIDKTKLIGMAGVELWYMIDEKGWVLHKYYEGKPASVRFQAPRDGKYGFLTIPVDFQGNRQFQPILTTQPEFTIVVDTIPPTVVLQYPTGGEMFPSGHLINVTWYADDGEGSGIAPNSVKIDISEDSGRSWRPVAEGLQNTGRYFCQLPDISSTQCRIRISLSDLAGNVSASESERDFIIDGLSPEALIAGPRTSSKTPVKLSYRAEDLGGAGLRDIKLYYTQDAGTTWKYYGMDDDLVSPFMFDMLDGTYGLYPVATDRVGNSKPPPVPGTPPQFTIKIDTTPPSVKLQSFIDSGIYMANHRYDIYWVAKDNLELPLNCISLYYSDNAGYTWTLIAKNIDNTGLFPWVTPKQMGDKYLLKITCVDILGHTSEFTSPPFKIETAIPEAKAMGPAKSSSGLVKIEYAITNKGYSPIKNVTLWYSEDEGHTWLRYGEDPDCQSPFEFRKKDGTYGIFITCASQVGLQTKKYQQIPKSGQRPQLVLKIDTTPPKLELLTFNTFGYYKAGDIKDILWRYEDKSPDTRGLSIFYSSDGGTTWEAVSDKLNPHLGKFRWLVPRRPGKAHLLKIIAYDTFGHKSIVVSEKPFLIDLEPPSLRIISRPPRILATRTITIEYHATDDCSGVANVEILGRVIEERQPYTRVAFTEQTTGKYNFVVDRDGGWEFLVIAIDGVGQKSKHEVKVAADFFVEIDTQKPRIDIEYFKTPQERIIPVNFRYEVCWRAEDTRTPRGDIKIKIEYSLDTGLTWNTAVERLDNIGKYSLIAILKPGKRYRLRITAFDKADNNASCESPDFLPDYVPLPDIYLSGIKSAGEYKPGETVKLRYEVKGNMLKDFELHEKSAEWADWVKVKDIDRKIFEYTIPQEKGQYFIRVVAKDPIGRYAISNVITFYSIEKLPPIPEVQLRGLRKFHNCGSSVLITWKVIGKVKKLILQRVKQGEQWKDVADVTGKKRLEIVIPDVPGKYMMRLKFVDEYARIGYSKPQEFEAIIPLVAIKKFTGIEDGKEYLAQQQFTLKWQVEGEPKKILLMIRRATERWKTIADLTDKNEYLFTIPTQPGMYELKLAVVDKYDVVHPRIVRFSVMPVEKISLRLVSFLHGGKHRGGGRKLVSIFATGITLEDVKIELSADSGKTWKEVTKKDLLLIREKGYLWRLPELTGSKFRLRVSYTAPDGTTYSDQSPKDFIIDSTPPEIVATKVIRTIKGPLKIEYRLKESISRVDEITIYFTENDGKTWKMYGKQLREAPLYFIPEEPVRYGFYLVAKSEVGLISTVPSPGTIPQIYFSVKKVVRPPPKEGEVRIISMLPAILKGGQKFTIEWKSAPEITQKVTLELFVRDKLHSIIAKDQPPTGKVDWQVPKIDARRCKIRARVVFKERELVGESNEFRIDSSAPVVEQAGIGEPD